MKREDVVETISNLKGETGHKKIIEVYNQQEELPRGYKMQMDDAWCAATVSAVFLINGYGDISECSCPAMIAKAKKLGIWVEDDAYKPMPGDIIMYDWQDNGKGDNQNNPDHVGIVIASSEDSITVREGNYSKTLKNRTIPIDAKYVRGFIVPPYDTEATDTLEGDLSHDTVSEDKLSTEEPKAEEKPHSEPERYSVGKTYTVRVRTSLNVRKGAGKSYGLVGYANLTSDGKNHAYANGALKNGTRVTCLEVKEVKDTVWIRIPSGWICGVDGDKVYVV